MAVQMTSWNRAELAGEMDQKLRQHDEVVNHLMKIAFGDPQVHRRVQLNPDFNEALNALDPHCPEFVDVDGIRNVIKLGCLQMIDHTAALLKFARENNMKLVS